MHKYKATIAFGYTDDNEKRPFVQILSTPWAGRLSILLAGRFLYGLGKFWISKTSDNAPEPYYWEFYHDDDGLRYFKVKNLSLKKRFEILFTGKSTIYIDGYSISPIV